jgi:cytoskeletal protein CcmA (bactofilin family)
VDIQNLKSGIAALLCMFAFNTQAIDFVQTNQFSVAETNALTDETWVSAQSVTIRGAVSNDFFATANDLSLNGTFNGDVWCMGDSITGAGVFRNSARMISRITQIQGTHYGSVIAAGTTVKIDRTAVLYRDLICLGENVLIEGSVSGQVRVFAQRVTLGGQFKNDLSIMADEIFVLPGTVINSDLTYTTPDELVLPSSVILGGRLNRQLQSVEPRRLFKENPAAHYMFALAALIAGLVFCGLFPRCTGSALHLLRESRGLCSLAGFAGLVVLPMASFFILLTLIGLPLGILILFFYFILLYLSKIIVALWIGSALLRRREFNRQKVAAPLALGLLILYTLTCITAAELIINILVMILGLGALLMALFKKPVLVIQTPNAINEINKEG